jgi:hypothetical protein
MSTPHEIIRTAVHSDGLSTRVIQQLEAAGFVIVPRLASEEMVEAAWAPAYEGEAANVWKAMVDEYLSTK